MTTKKAQQTIEQMVEKMDQQSKEQYEKYALSLTTNAEFRKEDAFRLVTLANNINECQKKAGSLARDIAGYLTEVYEKKLWKMAASSFELFCNTNFDIAKSTASEAITTFKRFKSPDGYAISDKYAATPWRSLVTMNKLSDDEITRLKLLECKSSTDVKARVKAYKELKDKLAPNWDNALFEALWLESEKEKERKKLEDISKEAEKNDKEQKEREFTQKVTGDFENPDSVADEEAEQKEESKRPAQFQLHIENMSEDEIVAKVREMLKIDLENVLKGHAEIIITK